MRNNQSAQLTRALLSAFIAAAAAVGAGDAEAACDATCQAGFITAHNAVRSRINSGTEPGPNGTFQPIPGPPLSPLSWNAIVAGEAQAYSNLCRFDHSGQDKGENLYLAGASQTPLQASTASVSLWEAESVNYTYAPIAFNAEFFVTGHYTQLAWANTTQVGCGVTTCGNVTELDQNGATQNLGPGTLVVCQYTPPGNWIGQYPYAVGAAVPRGPLDVDGNGQYDAKTDGLLILRYLFGLTGTALTTGAIGPGANRNTPALVLTHLQSIRSQLDVDANGSVDALTDGMLIYRYLSGLRGAHLINRAVGPGGAPQSSTAIEARIQLLKP